MEQAAAGEGEALREEGRVHGRLPPHGARLQVHLAHVALAVLARGLVQRVAARVLPSARAAADASRSAAVVGGRAELAPLRGWARKDVLEAAAMAAAHHEALRVALVVVWERA